MVWGKVSTVVSGSPEVCAWTPVPGALPKGEELPGRESLATSRALLAQPLPLGSQGKGETARRG